MVARGARGLLRVCFLLIILAVILIAVITAGARIGLPFLSAYKPSLENRLSDYLQSPVSIAELDARWVGTGPVLRARGVQLTDPLGRVAQFDELLMDLDLPRSLLAGAAVMDELTLVGADLALDYDRDNGIRVHGVNRGPGIKPPKRQNTGEGSSRAEGFNAVAWLLTAARVGMLDTRVTVQMPDNSTLLIEKMNIRAENRGDLHQIRMDMSLPDELGNAFEFGADINAGANDLRNASGNFYIKAANFKAAGIHQVLSAYDVNIPVLKALSQRGTNAQLELWGELKTGYIQRVNGRTAIAQSAAQDPTVDSLFGDLFWARDEAGGWQFAATDVVVGRQGSEAIFDEIRMGAADTSEVKPDWLALKTAETELQPVINTITTLLPSAMPKPVVEWLEDASPSAKIRHANVRMSLINPATSFSLSAQFDDSQWLPSGRQPGVRIAKLGVNIVDGRGQINLPAQTIQVLPPTLPSAGTPVSVDPLSLEQVVWNARIDLPKGVISGDLSALHQSASVALRHTLSNDESNRRQVDVQGQFAAKSVLDLKPWLSQSWVPKASRIWLDQAIQAGAVNNGRIEINGALDELLSREKLQQGDSIMRAEFDVSDGRLRFLNTWPEAEEVNASVVFDRTRLSSQVSSAKMDGLPVSKASATIEDLYNPELVMSVTSNTRLRSLVNFGLSSPLENFLAPVLAGAEVDGPARLEVAVVTPLRLPDPKPGETSKPKPWPVSVQGHVFLQDSNVKLALVDLPLKNVRGPIGFTEDGIELKTVRATLFGAKVRLNAASAGLGINRRTDIAVRGVMPARRLLEQFELPVAEFVSGSSQWRADASIPHSSGRLEKEGIALTVTSDLVGTAVALAEPLGKRSNSTLPLRISTRFKTGGWSDALPQVWRLTFGDGSSPQTDMRIAVLDDSLHGLVMSLGEALAEQQALPGIRVVGTADVLSIDGLVEDIATLIDALPETQGEPEKILPISVDVYGKQMRAGRTRIGDASVKVNTDDNFINFFINNAHLRGSLRYPREHWRNDIEAKARINFADKVLIDALSDESEIDALETNRIDPRTLPPIELHVNRFEWDQLVVDNLRVRTEPDIAGLRVRTFGFATGTTQLIGEGLWHLVDPQNVNENLTGAHTAQLHLTLQSSDLGKALGELGFQGVLAKGEGRVTASLNWQDAFYAPGLETVAARAELDLKRGRLLQIEPGAARLAGLFALQTLPRRFNFDFTDLVNDGLDFATITGDIALESGVANMRLVQLNGPVGVIDVTGTSNLITQQFDQTVTVLPRVSAALPIIGIISGGASAGVGALIAGGVLKAVGVDFDRLGLREYALTGTWNSPVFEPIKR